MSAPQAKKARQKGIAVSDAPNRGCTFEEFCFLIPDGQKADLIDGVIYMASPDNIQGARLFYWLLWLIDGFAEARELGGEVFGSRVAFRLGLKESPEPDLGYILKEHTHRILATHVEGPPDLAIEIVSPESVERDYRKKRAQYEQASVPEYWIIDPLREKVTLFHLSSQGKYREVRSKKGAYHSEVLPGFWLRAEWLWRTPLPRKSKVLDEILSAHP